MKKALGAPDNPRLIVEFCGCPQLFLFGSKPKTKSDPSEAPHGFVLMPESDQELLVRKLLENAWGSIAIFEPDVVTSINDGLTWEPADLVWSALDCVVLFFMCKKKTLRRAATHNLSQLKRTLDCWSDQPIAGSNAFHNFEISKHGKQVVYISIVDCDDQKQHYKIGGIESDTPIAVDHLFQFPESLVREMCKFPFTLLDLLHLAKKLEQYAKPLDEFDFADIVLELNGHNRRERKLLNFDLEHDKVYDEVVPPSSAERRSRILALFELLKITVDFQHDPADIYKGSCKNGLRDIHNLMCDLDCLQYYELADLYHDMLVASGHGKRAGYSRKLIGSTVFVVSTAAGDHFKDLLPTFKQIEDKAKEEGYGFVAISYVGSESFGSVIVGFGHAPESYRLQLNCLLSQIKQSE